MKLFNVCANKLPLSLKTQKFYPTNTDLGYIMPMVITCQQIELESCANSVDGESLVVCNRKNCFSFVCCFFVYVYMMGVCSCISSYILMTSSSPGTDQMSQFC